ncbi:Ig-like domain-containing protein [Microbacterium sp. ASV81]|uniref:Ig-like domain-containing protein n=1 Tax=Microbacterium capsulatum TaxID=3041921 RepID=A0ABU0XJC7_9MICO|nr:Ig-like domain-containing protein [Microbacterium sp. ASV81]MDQ4215245.1 Ig-like domain-containing protein [Microbacterium sp. ASV81]
MVKSFAWLRLRPKSLASAAAVTAASIAVAGMAFAYEGNPTAEVDLHDGGVWLTKTASLLVGHFNNESRVLDGGLRAASENYDVLQAGGTVLVTDHGSSTLTAVDPARVSLGDAVAVPGGAKTALGGTTVAILAPKDGKLWVLPASALGGFKATGSRPSAVLGPDADVTVGQDGTVYAVSAKDRAIVTVHVDAQGAPQKPSTEGIDLGQGAKPSITVVGATPVVLDAEAKAVYAAGHRTDLNGADARGAGLKSTDAAVLQQASAENSSVALATADALVSVPLDGSAPSVKEAGGIGAPAAPVFVKGCTYGAWGGSATFLRDCVGTADDLKTSIEGAEHSTSLVFRVNRDVVVLNDTASGAAWLATDNLQRVDNWQDIVPPEGDTQKQDQTADDQVETTLPKRTPENTPPVARDDTFGVRPGRTTMLPVLDNDSDADGDVLVASLAQAQPSIGEVQPINNGGALQIAVPDKASGSGTFQYQADDGRGGKATATVTIDVHDWSQNAPPKQQRVPGLIVEAGGSVKYNALPDWIDPDGDDMYLKDVIAAPGDQVDFTPDGQFTYHAIASMPGRKEIKVVVADALGELTTGTVRLDVRPAGTTEPKTEADHVVTRAGEQVTVSPLLNDSSSGREPLRLARVDEVPGAVLTPNFAEGTFTFQAALPGVYYAQYLASAGPNAVPGLVRIDVLDKTAEAAPPIAVRDVALLPAGGDVLVGVLNNDIDPAGGILVVQSVTVPPHSGISVSVLNHETVRVTDQGNLNQEVRFSYKISNGSKTAEGDVIVIPIPAPAKLEPPVVHDDTAVVRAGDVVTIPVLANDKHAPGTTLHVAPKLVEPLIDPKYGEAFVSQDTVRFRAGPTPRTVYATYEAVDSNGQKAAGYITIQILPVDEKTNTAPRPHDLTVRALSGTSVRIAVPLDGLDAEGDSVELVGLDSAPKQGQVTEIGENYLTYQAFDNASGVDAFTYKVRDRLGKEATATIRVGIAPGTSVNQPPYAVKDSIVTRPGRTIAVPVLANDSDPDGDVLSLVKNGLEVPPVDGLSAKVSGDRVLVTVPNHPVQTSVQYTVADSHGATATAPVQITVADDVPLVAPIARDDRVQASDVKGSSLQVEVPVLKNDEDPDGTVDDLQLSVADGDAKVMPDRTIQVTVTDQRQLIQYTITDQDKLTASAFVFVPALSELAPTLKSTKPLEVKSGETKELPLSQYVTVAGGGQVRITEAGKVSAVNANGSSLIKDEHTLVYTSKAGYFGDDALTFEVTDGTGPDDPKGRKATLSIPITVLPPDNQPPAFTNAQVSVAPGEPAQSVDLAALTKDPDPGDEKNLKYEIAKQPGGGLKANLEGSTLKVSADSSTPKGSAGTVQLKVTDGRTTPVDGTVSLTVAASTRPLAVANEDTVPQADQGKAVTIPVLENDINPFPDKPLKIMAVDVQTGTASSAVQGDKVVITPSKDFIGQVVATYRIQDATKDPDREVEGRIVVTVQGVPDAPGAPQVTSVQDRTVVLSWAPPSNNGAEITGYTVRATSGGSYTKQCASTTCTLDGLTNNVTYTFAVTATNRVGEGRPSPSSGPARPDARPDTPNPPTLKFGDKSLQVSWTTPTTPGSPVSSYTLEISPAPPNGVTQKTGVTGNSLTWDGLENGAAYQVRVQAKNLAPEPSSWSGWSATEIPAGPPTAPGTPTAQSAPSVGSQSQMTVSWTAAGANGDAISSYDLQVLQGGSVVRTITGIAGTTTSQNVTVDNSTGDYTFQVRGNNKAGAGVWSAASNARRAFGQPGATTITSATEGNNNIAVTYSLADANGASASEIHYEYSTGGAWSRNWDGRNIPAANNGTYTVSVRAYSVVAGQESQPGQAGSRSGLRPYGPVGTPGASATNNGTSVTLGWSAPAPNGRSIQVMRISVDGGAWQNVGLNGTTTVGNGYSQSHSIRVQAFDSASPQQSSQIATASATTDAPPQPKAWTTRGSSAQGMPGCATSGCSYYVINVSNYAAGSYQIQCVGPDGGYTDNAGYPVRIPANGSVQLQCYNGYPGQHFVRIVGGNPSDSTPATW